MEDKPEVLNQEQAPTNSPDVEQNGLSKGFESRREYYKHLLKGESLNFKRDYASMKEPVKTVLWFVDTEAGLMWNYGMRVPFLAVNQVAGLIRSCLAGKPSDVTTPKANSSGK